MQTTSTLDKGVRNTKHWLTELLNNLSSDRNLKPEKALMIAYLLFYAWIRIFCLCGDIDIASKGLQCSAYLVFEQLRPSLFNIQDLGFCGTIQKNTPNSFYIKQRALLPRSPRKTREG